MIYSETGFYNVGHVGFNKYLGFGSQIVSTDFPLLKLISMYE